MTTRSQGGLTLVELLVGLVLTGLIMGAAAGGLRLAIGAWKSGERYDEWLSGDLLVERWVQRQLAAVQVLPLDPLEEAADRPVFHGEPDRLAFVAALSARHGPPGLRRIELSVVSSRQALFLDYPLWGQARLSEGTGEPGRRMLLEGSFRFAYFGRRVPDAMPGWHDYWRDLPHLPMAVRLEVDYPHGSQSRDTTLVIRLPAATGGQ